MHRLCSTVKCEILVQRQRLSGKILILVGIGKLKS